MKNSLEKALLIDTTLRKPFLDRLALLFTDMDNEYSLVSDRYGFHCQGCEESCCRTTFYHHTILEALYLLEGFEQLGKDLRTDILKQAQKVILHPSEGLFCPLCRDNRCLLYTYRPMICRLHGIAHEVHRPDRAVSYGPGCALFEAVTEGESYIVFDRTRFYLALSRLEQEARAALGVVQKIKMTVSEILTYSETGAASHEKRKY